jgi:protein-tyrosine phosphatase
VSALIPWANTTRCASPSARTLVAQPTVFVLCAQAGISYMAIDARDDAAFRILDDCLQHASQFIAAAHSRGVGVLVHCMAGVNRC